MNENIKIIKDKQVVRRNIIILCNLPQSVAVETEKNKNLQ